MRNSVWKLCLIGVLSIAAASCGDSDDDSGGTPQQETTVPVPELGLSANLMATVEKEPLRVLLSWDYQGAEEVSFAVYRADTAAELAVQNLSAARLLATTEDVFFEDTNVVAGTTYYYRVRAFAGRQIGRASQLISVTIAADGTAVVDVVEREQPMPDEDGTTPPPDDDDTTPPPATDGTLPPPATDGTMPPPATGGVTTATSPFLH